MHVTIAASDANAAQQVRFTERISRVLNGLEGRTIGLLGLAFKAGTDDVRDSPALAVAGRLLAAGATVQAYDPQASANAARELPGLVIAESPAEALRGADAAVIGTEWPEFKALDWSYLKELLARPIVIDGRRIFDASTLRGLGLRYEAIGSPQDGSKAGEPIRGEVAAVE